MNLTWGNPKMKKNKSRLFNFFCSNFFCSIVFSSTVYFLLLISAHAEIKSTRWTLFDSDTNPQFDHILARLNKTFGTQLAPGDFLLLEETGLAQKHFKYYIQIAGEIPIRKTSIRIWTHAQTGNLIQLEAALETELPKPPQVLRSGRSALLSNFTIESSNSLAMRAAEKRVRSDEDSLIRSISASTLWDKGLLVRVIKITSRRGMHDLVVSLSTLKVLEHRYREFPNGETHTPQKDENEFSVQAQVFPIYEETYEKNLLQKTVPAELKYVKKSTARVVSDPYLSLRDNKYFEDKYDSLLGMTEFGRKQGYWSDVFVKKLGAKILKDLPKSENSFQSGGAILEGRYATISLHPDVKIKFSGIEFELGVSPQLRFDWRQTQVGDTPMWEMLPISGLIGKVLHSPLDAFNRPAIKDPDNNPVKYINEGFDEIQVYYAVTAFMESLQAMGFTDPELSTRPFNAFLFDPEISMADNAYYTSDTINFTTYTKGTPNMARDNPTIWHELGHGIMDRLMGDFISLADTGGLSEGMADFLAALVLADLTQNQPFDGWLDFRIINKIGFNLTNEVHDDGEAYGGAMKDLLDASIQKHGQLGVFKVTDLTLEAMRLSRNHPGLTANHWFDQMLFADQMGQPGVRDPGEMKELIFQALNGRNFNFDFDKPVADFSLKFGEQEVSAGAPGSRERPIAISIGETEKSQHSLDISLRSSETFPFRYPVQVGVQLRKGPLQGAIHWEGEENEPLYYTINTEEDALKLDLTIHGKCDLVNRDDGSCVDFAYIKIWNQGTDPKAANPIAKKRFYLRLKTKVDST